MIHVPAGHSQAARFHHAAQNSTAHSLNFIPGMFRLTSLGHSGLWVAETRESKLVGGAEGAEPAGQGAPGLPWALAHVYACPTPDQFPEVRDSVCLGCPCVLSTQHGAQLLRTCTDAYGV